MKIQVLNPDARAKFQGWIEKRGGVRVWDNVNMSDPCAGQMFTPALTEDGKPMGSPGWSHQQGELVTDLSRFAFAIPKEVKRVKIAVRMGSQGFTLKLTDASSRKLDKALDVVKEKLGVDPVYHFEGDEAVISIPLWMEDGTTL